MGRDAIYITDFDRCWPQTAISKEERVDKWRLRPYKANGRQGMMLIGEAQKALPELIYPLSKKGWYSIWIGMHKLDQRRSEMQIRLSKDEVSCNISLPEYLYEHYGWIQEGLWKCADLTDQCLVISKGLHNRAYLAYIKLVPLSDREVTSYKKDQEQQETKIVGGVIDVYSVLSAGPPFTEDIVKGEIEPFVGSDFKKICWGVHAGGRLLYHTKIGDIFGAGQRRFHNAGAKNCAGFMAASLRNGFDPLAVAVEYAHKNGLELHADFRMSHQYPLGAYEDNFSDTFYREHQHMRCVKKDGQFANNLSHAYPEVSAHRLSLLKEIAENYDIDGIYLDFLRFPPYLLYEEPLISGFKKKHSRNPRQLHDHDLQWLYYRAEFMTQFMRDLRGELKKIEAKRGRRIEVTAQVDCNTVFGPDPACYRIDNNLVLGLDIKTWIDEELIDILSPSNSRMYTNISLDHFRLLLKGKQCKLWPCLGQTDYALYPDDYRWDEYFAEVPHKQIPLLDAKRLMRHASDLYNQGAEGLFLWEAGGVPSVLVRWQILKNLGHRKELAAEFGTQIGRFDGQPVIAERYVKFLDH